MKATFDSIGLNLAKINKIKITFIWHTNMMWGIATGIVVGGYAQTFFFLFQFQREKVRAKNVQPVAYYTISSTLKTIHPHHCFIKMCLTLFTSSLLGFICKLILAMYSTLTRGINYLCYLFTSCILICHIYYTHLRHVQVYLQYSFLLVQQ